MRINGVIVGFEVKETCDIATWELREFLHPQNDSMLISGSSY